MATVIWHKWLKRLEGKDVSVTVKLACPTGSYGSNKKETEDYDGELVLVEEDSFLLKETKGEDTHVLLISDVLGLTAKVQEFQIKSEVEIRPVKGKKLGAAA